MSFNIKTKKILSEDNCKRIIQLGISLRDEIEKAELGLITDYDETRTYTKGDAVYYNNYLYKCKYATTGTFDESKWQLIGDELSLVTKADIEAMLGLTQEEIETLQKILNDAQITLSAGWSSSKIYSELLSAIDTSKQFTLDQFAKVSKASYQVITNLSSATDKSIIYLLLNSTSGKYDMYIVEADGTVEKIGDLSVDLSNYYTKTEIDNDFVKKTDADGKYATITTVDGKAEKTDLENHINDTDIHITADERTAWNGKVDKDSILSNLNISPTAKQVYNAPFVNNIIKNSSYYYNANTDRTNTNERKKAIQYVINKLNGIYSVNKVSILGDGNVNIPSTVFTIRYSGGYYYTYIVSNAYSAINILEYCPYEYSLDMWREIGNDLTIGAWSQIFNNKDNTTISNAFSDETYYKLISASYSIRNGVCYMQVQVKCITPYIESNEYCNVATISSLSIPTPEIQSYKLLFDIESNTGCNFYIGSSLVQMKGGKAGTLYRGEFSYPIKIKNK